LHCKTTETQNERHPLLLRHQHQPAAYVQPVQSSTIGKVIQQYGYHESLVAVALSTFRSSTFSVIQRRTHATTMTTDNKSSSHHAKEHQRIHNPKWYNNHEEWNLLLREIRHNPCFMRPITTIVLLCIVICSIIITILRFPTLLLGFIATPLLNKFYWVVEFWYPTGIGKQIHFWMIRLSSSSNKKGTKADANRGYHSRCTETRIELIPQRIYIHPLPQLIDNLGYLVVCLPPPVLPKTNIPLQKEVTALGSTLYVDPHGNSTNGNENDHLTTSTTTKIVAFIVDCGDATAVLEQIQAIRQVFYNDAVIHVQSILSTHKHHDHTAGNIQIMKILNGEDSNNNNNNNDDTCCGPIRLIFGGAVDKVPGCNYPLANRDKLPLPKSGYNDMNACIEIEAIATPAHTRGSMSYIVRPLLNDTNSTTDSTSRTETDICIFTGDTIFSAGGGVPFEADIDSSQEALAAKMTANHYIQATAATYAIERCFAEVLYRSVPSIPSVNSISSPLSVTTTTTTTSATSGCVLNSSTRDRVIILPGHEYSQELLSRQLLPSSSSASPLSPSKWKNFEPSFFFHTVSQYYVTLHRRTSLPISSSGTLLTIPTTLSREIYINPHLRSLRQRGMTIITALKLWNRYFAKDKIIQDMIEQGPAFSSISTNADATNTSASNTTKKTRAHENQWNLNSTDLNEQVFTTVYSSDLDTIIEELKLGQIDTSTAAIKLNALKVGLQQPILGRRAIPGTLPSSRAVYRGLVALTLLGSAPTALTRSDGEIMKIPEPIANTSCSDNICISKRRLVTVLFCLGLLDDKDGKFIVAIIQQLWKEVKDVSTKDWKRQQVNTSNVHDDTDAVDMILEQSKEEIENMSTDVESIIDSTFDECELGTLKWVIYGIPGQQKSKSLFSKFCVPCDKSSGDDSDDLPTNPTHTAARMKRHGGELVRHDVFTCPLCRTATGCPVQQIYSNQIEMNDNGYIHQIMTVGTTVDQRQDEDCHDDDNNNDDESTTFIEVSPNTNTIASMNGI
jgi:glyoxylase-like metal-dependent hydrolase (beta-lactamase superfamily II)